MNAEEEKLKERIAEIKEILKPNQRDPLSETSRERFLLEDELKKKEKQLRTLRGEPEPDPDDENCKFCSVMGGRKKTRRKFRKRGGAPDDPDAGAMQQGPQTRAPVFAPQGKHYFGVLGHKQWEDEQLEKQLRRERKEEEERQRITIKEQPSCNGCTTMGGRKRTRRRKKAKRGRTAKRRKMAKRRKTAKRGKKTKREKTAKRRVTKRQHNKKKTKKGGANGDRKLMAEERVKKLAMKVTKQLTELHGNQDHPMGSVAIDRSGQHQLEITLKELQEANAALIVELAANTLK